MHPQFHWLAVRDLVSFTDFSRVQSVYGKAFPNLDVLPHPGRYLVREGGLFVIARRDSGAVKHEDLINAKLSYVYLLTDLVFIGHRVDQEGPVHVFDWRPLDAVKVQRVRVPAPEVWENDVSLALEFARGVESLLLIPTTEMEVSLWEDDLKECGRRTKSLRSPRSSLKTGSNSNTPSR